MNTISKLVIVIAAFLFLLPDTRGANIYVSTNIQAAINAASPGDVIHLAAGKYPERLTINKSLSIVGSGTNNCVIYSYQTDWIPLITITGPATVSLSNFELNGGAYASWNNWYNGFSPLSITATNANVVMNSLVLNQVKNYFVTIHGGSVCATNVAIWTVDIDMGCDVGFELDNCVAVLNGLTQDTGHIDHTVNINMDSTGFSDVQLLNSHIRASRLTWGNCLRTYCDSKVVITNCYLYRATGSTEQFVPLPASQTHDAIGVYGYTNQVIIAGNTMVNLPWAVFVYSASGGVKTSMESNSIINSIYGGIFLDGNWYESLDLGGGSFGSRGGNVFSQSRTASTDYQDDVFYSNSSAHHPLANISALHNTWSNPTNADAVIRDQLDNSDYGRVATGALPIPNQPPTFAIGTDTVAASENAGLVTISNLLTGITPGSANEASQSLTFTVKSSGPLAFTTNGFPSVTRHGTLGNLTFQTATNAWGTNVITLVAKDSGGTANGGVNAATNTFNLGVSWVNQHPRFGSLVSQSLLENSQTNVVTVYVYDVDSDWCQLTLTAISSNTAALNLAVSDPMQAVQTNVLAGTNAAAFTLSYQPTQNSNGPVTVCLLASDGNGTAKKTITVNIVPVNQAPTTTVTGDVEVVENAGWVTITNLLRTIKPGPANESTQSVTFTVKSKGNVPFATSGFPTVTQHGTLGNLTFQAASNSYGSDVITVITKDNGGTTNGGVNAVTNTFNLTVDWVNQTPHLGGVKAVSMLENSQTNTASVYVYDVDSDWSALTLAAYSSNTAVVDVAVTAGAQSTQTNMLVSTNAAAFTLAFTPVANSNGPVTIWLVGSDGNSNVTNKFILTVVPVNQPPTTTVTGDVEVAENAGWVTITNLLRTIRPGPANESTQRVTFTVKSSGNVSFATNGFPTVIQHGTLGNLTFQAATNSYGSDVITVVTKDNGGTANGGINAVTNTFNLVVDWVNQAPRFNLAATKLTVGQYGVPVTRSNFVSAMTGGPGLETNQVLTLTVTDNHPELFSAAPAIDAYGTLTFTPATVGGADKVIVSLQDDGGTDNMGVDTTAKTFSIVVPANPFTGVQGNFAGLFYSSNSLAFENSGYYTMALANDGTYSGYVLGGNASNAVNGQFSATNTTLVMKVPSLGWRFSLTLPSTNTLPMTGTVTTPNGPANLLSYLGGTWPGVGQYNLQLPMGTNQALEPNGCSIAALAVNPDGTAGWSGFMADDACVTGVSQTSVGGYVPIYLPLTNGNNSAVFGWLAFTNGGSNRLLRASWLAWIKESGGDGYPLGFTNLAVPGAYLYDPANPTSLSSSGIMVFSGGNLAKAVTNAVSIADGVITAAPSVKNGLSLALDPNTGEISGQFTAPNGEINVVNMLILTSKSAKGYFRSPSQAGLARFIGN